MPMEKAPTVHDLLHDPTLSFTDFCIITSALKNGDSEDKILMMPELAHLRITEDPGPEE
jgi:hypothetical protein